MDPLRRHLNTLSIALLAAGTLLTSGCASPGPPRSPSLHLPLPVSDLAAARTGNTVTLRFTLPHLTTERLPLFDTRQSHNSIRGVICRELDHHDCMAVAAIQPALTGEKLTTFTWSEELPPALTTGPPHLLGYRVEFFNPAGRSAGRSDAAYTASGPAPQPVAALQAEGTRDGVLLRWQSSTTPGDVLLQRTELAPAANSKHDTPELWLNANATASGTLDNSVAANEPYRYLAVRRVLVPLGGRTFDLRSVPSAPADITLREIYAPAAPTGLTAAGFQPPAAGPESHYTVDLIWQPVDDSAVTAKLAAPMLGYNLYREPISPDGRALAPRALLNPTPLLLPGFHDTTADPATRYRYSVTTIDANHNESAAASAVLEPNP